MPLHELDFASRPSPFTPIGSVLLLIGLVLAGLATLDVVDGLAQRDSAEEKQAQLVARVAELRGAKIPQARSAKNATGQSIGPDDKEERRIAEAKKVIRNLAAPWNELFDALEKAQDDTVALLSITPERAAGQVSLTGEAKSYEALTDYLTRLDDSGVFASSQLLGYEIKGGDRNVVFSATTSFSR